MSRALARSFWCHACRRDILQSFAAVSGVTIPRPLPPNCSLRRSKPAPGASRWQSSTHDGTTETPGNNVENKPPENTSVQSQLLPWYLQADNQAQSPHPLGQQQELPPLPENPPIILESLLQHLSVDIGLDDLALLDLRGRDPPPALGGNLLMVVGSARSTKHLNVSADRFCRWLRSTYKLRPYADGLLGRNELKLKLRRKARRARIASEAGASIETKDDGITTGWICVNVGIVEDSESAARKTTREEAFEGFGKSAGGTRIVVQMFTDEKRAEIDLETLWGTGSLENTKNRGVNSSSEDPVEDTSRLYDSHKTNISERSNPSILKAPINIDFTQKRRFSTSFPRFSGNSAMLRSSQAPNLPQLEYQERSWSTLFAALSQLPPERIREELGEGPADKSSSFFLQFIHREISEAPPSESSTARLKLMCVGIRAGHPSYVRRELFDAFEEHVSNGYMLSDELGFEIVSSLLAPEDQNTAKVMAKPESPERSSSESTKDLALELLDYLSLRGTNVLHAKVINLLYEYNKPSTYLPTDDIGDDDPINYYRPIKSNAGRMSKIIDSIDVPFDSQGARAQMELRFRYRDFEGFWDLWRSFSFNKIARTSEDYALLFRLHADLGDPERARDCVMTWVVMMEREEPPVPLQGEVAEQVLACVLLCDDAISEREHNGPPYSLGKIWERCMDTLAS